MDVKQQYYNSVDTSLDGGRGGEELIRFWWLGPHFQGN